MPAPQARYWLLTIPVLQYPVAPTLHGDLIYVKGQREIGRGGFNHWQLLAVFKKKLALAAVKRHFCPEAHCEPSRSDAANEYVWKEDTRVPDTQFELGELPISRARKADWDKVKTDAESGKFNDIPADILIRHYGNIKRLRVDAILPQFRPEVRVHVFWGVSGTGKTRRAWHEAGDPADVFIKDPNTKWWDGYRGQKKVIIDEFTGLISIGHLLRWIDRYPVIAEVKGFSLPLEATEFWITSNIDPRDWYSDINDEQRRGLMRRIHDCVHFSEFARWEPPVVLEGDNDVFNIDEILDDLLA